MDSDIETGITVFSLVGGILFVILGGLMTFTNTIYLPVLLTGCFMMVVGIYLMVKLK